MTIINVNESPIEKVHKIGNCYEYSGELYILIKTTDESGAVLLCFDGEYWTTSPMIIEYNGTVSEESFLTYTGDCPFNYVSSVNLEYIV